MRHRVFTLVTGVLFLVVLLPISGGVSSRAEQRRPGSRSEDSRPLSDEQKARVAAILSRFEPNELTPEIARAIHEAFRQAGLRAGPAMADAIRAAGFDPDKLRDLAPPPDPSGEEGRRPAREGDGNDRGRNNPQGSWGRESRKSGGYSIEQAVSDQAQLHTIAFDALAFLTGDLGCNTFLPPGKVADFCGFQYMRDVDANGLGHNTAFVPRAANNVLCILNADQKAKLVALAREQETLLTDFACRRFPLIKAFHRQLEGDVPAGSTGLDRGAVMRHSAGLYELDGQLSYQRARVLGEVLRSLTDSQRAYLARMAFGDSSTWPELPDQLDRRSLSPTAHVAVMTYASEMFSWYAGNVEADTYFCPERHATYFGSFYLKDIPAMGNRNYAISTSLTGNSGEAFLATLTEPQRRLVTNLVDQQRADLGEIVRTRRAIATQLRRFMTEGSIDRSRVLALARRYGELDGEISYFYARAFAEVGRTLTPEQKAALRKLRNLDARYDCRGAYLYSRPIAMPVIPPTDFLFTADSHRGASSGADRMRAGHLRPLGPDGSGTPAGGPHAANLTKRSDS
ncbi:MAG: hypothetical protein KA419_02710 [Acidobacteria bacterium]|nr:hypothetical protein [Acidobacteriota bacterium]